MDMPHWPCAAPVGDWLCSNLAFDSLVAGHYQPLADNPGIAPESDQTRSLQSDQRTLGSRRGRLRGVLVWLIGGCLFYGPLWERMLGDSLLISWGQSSSLSLLGLSRNAIGWGQSSSLSLLSLSREVVT